MENKKPITMLDCEMGFAEPGSHSIIDCINPVTSRSWIEDETLEQIRLRYPTAEIINLDDWCKAKADAQDSPIEWAETTAERYQDMLEVLPPAMWIGGGFLVGEPSDHHATSGQPRFAAHIQRGGKYFESSRPLTRSEFKPLAEHARMSDLISSAAEIEEQPA